MSAFRLIFFLLFSPIVFGLEFDPQLQRIDLSPPLKVVNLKILESAEVATRFAIRNAGPRFSLDKLRKNSDVLIETLFKDSTSLVQGLSLSARVYVGGYIWFGGYREDWLSCKIHIARGKNDDWSYDGQNVAVACDFESLK